MNSDAKYSIIYFQTKFKNTSEIHMCRGSSTLFTMMNYGYGYGDDYGYG